MPQDTQTPKEKYDDLKRRYNSMVEASLRDTKKMHNLEDEVRRLGADNKRLAAEAEASAQNTQLLADDFNQRGQVAGEEVNRLRALLKKHGISPD